VVLREDDLRSSTNPYDWLGDGIYFWEGSLRRAEEWALDVAGEEPEVLGAVISLGHCLDLLDQECLDHVWQTYDRLRAEARAAGKRLPRNRGGRRELDRMVLNEAASVPPQGRPPFDSVRAAFMEGSLLAKDSGLHRQSHIQIAVHNPVVSRAS
jgi:hypothetical protein